MLRVLVASALPALLLLACGGESEEDRVESVIRAYVDHYVDSRPSEMYALLDAGSRQRCSEENFVAFTSAAREALGERKFEIAEIADIVIEGDSASATIVSTVDGEPADATQNTLVREDGDWKLQLPSIGC